MSQLSRLLLLVPLGVPLLASEPATVLAPAVSTSSTWTESGALERALERITADDIEADLGFIASDELEGRDTPSQGLRLAARYIRARLQRLGFVPAGDDGYFDQYELTRTVLDTGNTRAVIERDGSERELVFGEDYYFRSGVGNSDLEAPVVYVGTATAEELTEVDLTGKIAFCHQNDEVSSSLREENCRARGAVGLLVAAAPGGDDMIDRMAGRAARWMSRGSLRLHTEDSFPQVYLTSKAAQACLPSSGIPPVVGQGMRMRFRDTRRVKDGGETYQLENVAGLWPGSDPQLAGEVIVISAHYDHVGVDDSSGEIYNGADDNGSGTCGLLALADALAEYGPMRRSILLLWVSGEEKGLLGSEAWTRDPTLPEGYRAVADLNIDMIGRNAPDSLLITPTQAHEAYNFLTKMAERMAPLEGFGPLGDADAYWSRSDHANFSQHLDIPVAFLFSDVHEDYHQVTDTVEKIDFDKIRRVTRLVFRMMAELQGEDLDA